MTKVLKLTIKRKWADLIISGKKPWEYRGNVPYYKSRLLEHMGEFSQIRVYDEIHLFIGGYLGYDLPHIKIKWKSQSRAGLMLPQNGEIVNPNDFALDVSEILEVKNNN